MSTDLRLRFAHDYVARLSAAIAHLPMEALSAALGALESVWREGRQVFLIGNGGSAATASHMANDLLWGMAQAGHRPFRVIALSDNVPLLTAIANDDAYREVFTHPLRALAQPGDLLLVISGSGNSPNVVAATELAVALGLRTVAFLGKGGGRLAAMVEHPVVVPSDDYGPIEDLHMMFDHLTIAWFRDLAARERA